MPFRGNLPLKVVLFAGNGQLAREILMYNFKGRNIRRDVVIQAVVAENRNVDIVRNIIADADKIREPMRSNLREYNDRICIVERNGENDNKYDKIVTETVFSKYPDADLVVFANWYRAPSLVFLNTCPCPIINTHLNIRAAWDAYRQGGSVDYGTVEVRSETHAREDSEVVCSENVEIQENDSFMSFDARMRMAEQHLLPKAIRIMREMLWHVYRGKVRDMYVIDGQQELLLMRHSDRISAFNKDVGVVRGKGQLLNTISAYWFNCVPNYIRTHYLYHSGHNMVVRRTRPIKLEIIVRGYLAGSSPTSIWTMYKNGERVVYGHRLPDGLAKNQALPEPIVTPTTKGEENDVPITAAEIIKQGILSRNQWDYINSVALRLYNWGTEVAAKAGMILVDTKYEFGFDRSGRIVLIDEIHTPDSSRYWLRDSYDERMRQQQEPEKLDKDILRDYLQTVSEDDAAPMQLPEHVSKAIYAAYYDFAKRLGLNRHVLDHPFTHSYYDTMSRYVMDSANVAVVIAGSTSDNNTVEQIRAELQRCGVVSVKHFASAHKQARQLEKILAPYTQTWSDRRIVFITVAGMSNALSGYIAGNYPGAIVIACPPFQNRAELMVDINSSLMMPSNVPVMTVVGAKNAAQAAARILSK